MTLEELLTSIKSLDADAPVVFATETADIGAGYHVTELKRPEIIGIDCGGRIACWTEASVQILDGAGTGSHMKAGKLAGIIGSSLEGVGGLGTVPVHVEFAPENAGLRIYDIAAPEREEDRILVRLTESNAICKPLSERRTEAAVAGCCGGSGVQAAVVRSALRLFEQCAVGGGSFWLEVCGGGGEREVRGFSYNRYCQKSDIRTPQYLGRN